MGRSSSKHSNDENRGSFGTEGVGTESPFYLEHAKIIEPKVVSNQSPTYPSLCSVDSAILDSVYSARCGVADDYTERMIKSTMHGRTTAKKRISRDATGNRNLRQDTRRSSSVTSNDTCQGDEDKKSSVAYKRGDQGFTRLCFYSLDER